MSSKSDSYKKQIGSKEYRDNYNSILWDHRQNSEQRRKELKSKLKAIKAKKQANSTIEQKIGEHKGVKFCDTGLGLGVSMGDF